MWIFYTCTHYLPPLRLNDLPVKKTAANPVLCTELSDSNSTRRAFASEVIMEGASWPQYTPCLRSLSDPILLYTSTRSYSHSACRKKIFKFMSYRGKKWQFKHTQRIQLYVVCVGPWRIVFVMVSDYSCNSSTMILPGVAEKKINKNKNPIILDKNQLLFFFELTSIYLYVFIFINQT